MLGQAIDGLAQASLHLSPCLDLSRRDCTARGTEGRKHPRHEASAGPCPCPLSCPCRHEIHGYPSEAVVKLMWFSRDWIRGLFRRRCVYVTRPVWCTPPHLLRRKPAGSMRWHLIFMSDPVRSRVAPCRPHVGMRLCLPCVYTLSWGDETRPGAGAVSLAMGIDYDHWPGTLCSPVLM